jgi:hypothetical protein
MAAGLGFKDFTTGEVLTAADVDGYLMQGVWVFASAAARDAAVTSPQEGNFAYLKDTNVTTYYTGSAWANLDTTGMTNPMTTTGDTIYSSSGSTPARLGIGSTGQVLTVAAGVPSWATPAGGGANWTLLNSGGTSISGAAQITVSGISGANQVLVLIDKAKCTSANFSSRYRINTDSGTNYYWASVFFTPSYDDGSSFYNQAGIVSPDWGTSNTSTLSGYLLINGCNSSGVKTFQTFGASTVSGKASFGAGYWSGSATVSSVSFRNENASNFDSGTMYVYTSAS